MNERSRNFLITWNEEKCNCDVLEYVNSFESIKYICVSDLEIGEENSYKHRHILVSYNNARYFKSELEKWKINDNQNHIEIVRNVKMSLEYCCKIGKPLLNTFPTKFEDDNFSSTLIKVIEESNSLWEVFQKVPQAWHKANMIKMMFESHREFLNMRKESILNTLGINEYKVKFTLILHIINSTRVRYEKIIGDFDFIEECVDMMNSHYDDYVSKLEENEYLKLLIVKNNYSFGEIKNYEIIGSRIIRKEN